MARRKSSLSLLLSALLLHTVLVSSNSTTLTSAPSWPSIHQLQTRGPEFSVLATDDGVPTLESGEKPAKDPQLIIEGPLPIDTPDSVDLPNDLPTELVDGGEIIDSTPAPPSGDTTDEIPEIYPSSEDQLDSPTDGSNTPSKLPNPPKTSQAGKEPKSSKKPKPSAKPATDADQQTDFNSDSETGTVDDDKSGNFESSPKLDEETGTNSGSTGGQFFGNDIDDSIDSVPEPSNLPDSPLSSKPSASPISSASGRPSELGTGKESNSSKPLSAAATVSVPQPIKTPKSVRTSPEPEITAIVSIPKPSGGAEAVVEVPETDDLISEESETDPEPSSHESDDADPNLPPTATASVPNTSNNPGPTAVVPTTEPDSGSESAPPTVLIPTTSSGSDKDSGGSNEPTLAPNASSSPSAAIAIEQDKPVPTEQPGVTGEGAEGNTDASAAPSSADSDDASTTVLDDSYSCVFFGEGDVPKFSVAEPELFSGIIDTYTAASSFDSLPPQFLSHTFGKSWNYSLLADGNTSYDIVLGFAETYGEACSSDVDSGFRLFSVSIDTQMVDIDVRGTVGCGKPLQKLFPKVSPQNGTIIVHFEAITQNAMLSTMCYRESEGADDGKVDETPTPSPFPELTVTQATPTPEISLVTPSPASPGKDDKFDNQFVQPNATYSCVNFAARTVGSYQLFDESSMDGNYLIYKGSGVALNPTLPMPYRYHAYGEKWTYHLKLLKDTAQTVVLGFAEVFPKACASGKNGSFRVFTVSIGEDFQIVDVMKSFGCGVVFQVVFRNVKPKDQTIDLNFNAVSGKAMLSVVCYGDASTSDEETTPTKTPEPEAVAEEDTGASLGDSKQSEEQCFQFGDNTVTGFTNIEPTELGNDVQVYTDEFANVNSTTDSEVYTSHIFGPQFTVTLDIGSASSITVELGFAEIYKPGCKEGFRVFTVEAGAEIKTIDVFKEVGCNSEFTFQLENIPHNISGGGKIDIAFKAITNFAMVSSLCVIEGNGVSDSGTSPSLVSIFGTDGIEGSPSQANEESPEVNISANQTPLLSEGSSDQSAEPEVDDDSEAVEGPLQESPVPTEAGPIVVNVTEETATQGNPTPSSYPKVDGLIDASITVSPAATKSPTALAQPAPGIENSAYNGEGGGASGDQGNSTDYAEEENPSKHDEDPQPSDELLASDFSQTTIGEDFIERPTSSPDPANGFPGSSSQQGMSGASGSESASSAPSPSAFLSPTESPIPSPGDGTTIAVISPTSTLNPTVSLSPSITAGNDSVPDKQDDITIEAPSASPTGLTVVIEAPSPSSNSLNVTIEAPSPSSAADSVIIIGTGPGTSASTAPTPTIISAAAFSPVPSAGVPLPSPSPPAESSDSPASANVTPQPLVTAVEPDTAPTAPPSEQSASPVVTPAITGDDVLSPLDSTPSIAAILQPSTSGNPNVSLPPPGEGTPDGTEILPPVNTSPGPQGDPDGSGPAQSALSSPPPVATISQNQIIVIPSGSALAIPTRTPTPVILSPSPLESQVPDSGGTSQGIGAPDGVVTGSAAPDSTSSIPTASPLPDIVTNPSGATGSSPQATPSPSRATSSVGSSQVIVHSQTPAPSPDPTTSISVGGPAEGPVEVADNTTEIIQVTGDIGTGGSDEDNQPSILVGEYKDLIATTPAGSGFAIGMGIVGSLLVILLLVVLFFAIFRGGGAAYSYSSGYSSHKRTDGGPNQGRYTDDLGPTGYGNDPSHGQNTQDGYSADPVTFESRPEGQSEAFGFEMPAAGGLGAPEDAIRRNEEPDRMAEYSSLNLPQETGYGAAFPETAEYRGSREIDIEQSTRHPLYPGAHASQTDKTRNNDSYGSNPGEYTFTGTFTMPNTGFSQTQRDREHEDYRDPGPVETEPQFRGSATMQDSFNDHHSVARPTMTLESSGKQERVPKNFTYSKLMTDSRPATELRNDVAPSSPEGALVDDVRSSLLDSEQASSSYTLSMGSNPAAGQSPYETELNANMAESDSGNVIERNIRPSARGVPAHLMHTSWQETHQVANEKKVDNEPPTPLLGKTHNELMTGATNSAQTHAAGRSVPPSSGSNDEPWPWWWSEENMGQHRNASALAKSAHRTEGKENSPVSSNGATHTERYRHSGVYEDQKIGAHVNTRTDETPKSAEIQANQLFVPDSSWRRQYSSTSDEEQDETPSNTCYDELRRRREPYVRAVANRLSAGPGSFSMSASGESVPEEGKQKFEVEEEDRHALEFGRDVSSWITRDPVEV